VNTVMHFHLNKFTLSSGLLAKLWEEDKEEILLHCS